MNVNTPSSFKDLVITQHYTTPIKTHRRTRSSHSPIPASISQLKLPDQKILAAEKIQKNKLSRDKATLVPMWNISQMQRDFFDSDEEALASKNQERPELSYQTPVRRSLNPMFEPDLNLSELKINLSSKAELKTKDPHEIEIKICQDSSKKAGREVACLALDGEIGDSKEAKEVISAFDARAPASTDFFVSDMRCSGREAVREHMRVFQSSEKKKPKNEMLWRESDSHERTPNQKISDFKLEGVWGEKAKPNYSEEPLSLKIQKGYAFETFIRHDSPVKYNPDALNGPAVRHRNQRGIAENPNVIRGPTSQLHLNLVDLNLDEVDAMSFDLNGQPCQKIENPNNVTGMTITNFMNFRLPPQCDNATGVRNYSGFSKVPPSLKQSQLSQNLKLSDLQVSDFFGSKKPRQESEKVCYSCRYKVKWAQRRRNLRQGNRKISNRMKFEKLNPRIKSRKKRDLRVICTCEKGLIPREPTPNKSRGNRLLGESGLFNFSDLKLDIFDIRGIDLEISESEIDPEFTDRRRSGQIG